MTVTVLTFVFTCLGWLLTKVVFPLIKWTFTLVVAILEIAAKLIGGLFSLIVALFVVDYFSDDKNWF